MTDPVMSMGAAPRAWNARPDAVPDLAQAAREFEGYLVGAMMRVGTRPLSGESLLDGGSAGRMYREQLYEEVARLAARGEGFGIARLLEGAARVTESAGEEVR
ncbi:MAG: rod-binding protein [Myxococcota bacterium]